MQLKQLRADIEEKKQRRDFLRSAKVCKADLIESVVTHIDAAQEKYMDQLHCAVDPIARNPAKTQEMLQRRGLPLLTAPAQHNIAGTVGNMEIALFALLGEQLKPAIIKAIDRLDWSDVGPPLVEREKEISKLDTDISKLEAQMETVAVQINQARNALNS